MTGHYTMIAQLGDWTFWAWDGHPFEAHEGKTLYAYEPVRKPGEPGKPNTGEWFASLDRALIGAVGEKYTGPRGAGGTGVGTAADWFARMIGMDELVAVDYQAGQSALQDVLVATAKHNGPIYRRASAITTELEKRGLTLAAMNHS
jgi:hypothetical protein